jgi:hypothetical protein
MNQGMTWPILAAVMGVSLAACGATDTSGEGRGDASTGDAGEPNPGASDAANDVNLDAPNEASDGGGATMDAADGSSTSNVAVCPPLPDGGAARIGIGPDESVASGTLVGSAVNCSICDVGASVYGQTAQDGGTPLAYTLYIPDTDGDEITCMAPSDALNGSLFASIQLNGIQLGTYSSSQSNSSDACTNIVLSYLTSPTPDCQGAVGPNCPVGCETFGCIDTDSGAGAYCPCEAVTYGADYSASGLCGTPSPFGSWQVVLTSVVPYAGDAGQTAGTVLYTVHGSVSADLIAESNDGGPPAGDHATLSLTF